MQASELLTKPDILRLIETKLAAIAKTTETEAEWVRRRLREEATDFSKSSTLAARVRAVELIAKLNGQFELDNRQKNSMTVCVRRTHIDGVAVSSSS